MTDARRRPPSGPPPLRRAGSWWDAPAGRQAAVRVGGGLCAACVVLGLGLVAAQEADRTPAADRPAAAGGHQVAGAAAPPGAGAVESVAASRRVVFRVWGSATAGVETVYGGGGGGGRTTRLPVTASAPAVAGAATYRLTARLRGDGDVHCSVTADGRTRTGHATGGERVCAVELDVPGGRD